MKKVILVDNMTATLYLNRTLSGRSGITVFPVPTNEDALVLHAEKNVDLIVTKLEMPGMNGEELCSRIRRDRRLSHVAILLTCANSESEIKRCVQCQASAYLAKPFSSEELIRAAMRLLDVAPRKTFRILVRVSAAGSKAGSSFYCTLVNVSSSGMLVESNTRLSEGDPLVCSFHLPGRTTGISVRGHVARIVCYAPDSYQYGIRFSDISREDRADIETFVGQGKARPVSSAGRV